MVKPFHPAACLDVTAGNKLQVRLAKYVEGGERRESHALAEKGHHGANVGTSGKCGCLRWGYALGRLQGGFKKKGK